MKYLLVFIFGISFFIDGYAQDYEDAESPSVINSSTISVPPNGNLKPKDILINNTLSISVELVFKDTEYIRVNWKKKMRDTVKLRNCKTILILNNKAYKLKCSERYIIHGSTSNPKLSVYK